MPVIQRLVDHDENFKKVRSVPIFINDLSLSNHADRQYAHSLITTQLSSDMISLLPSCQCGKTKYQFSVGIIKCRECKQVVKPIIESEIDPILWFRKPEDIENLINLSFLSMLKQRFKKTSFNIIEWLTLSHYNPVVRKPTALLQKITTELLEPNGIKRSYNSFVKNYDLIMEYLFSIREFKVKKGEIDWLHRLVTDTPKHKIFCQHMPIPNKAFLIVENTNVGIYVDQIIVGAIDAIQGLVSIDKDFIDKDDLRKKENHVAKALHMLSAFYDDFIETNLQPKPGYIRRQTIAGRTIFSFRAVISPIIGPHEYNEVHVPWGIGLTTFRPMLMNKLYRLGYSRNKAIELILSSVGRYNELLARLLDELIEEAPDKRLWIILQRNPSLLQGSAQFLGISKFKKNVLDRTLSMSTLIAKAYNADYDGDALNGSYSVDLLLTNDWKTLAPENNILQLDKPFEVSGYLSIPKPVICSMSNWLDS